MQLCWGYSKVTKEPEGPQSLALPFCIGSDYIRVHVNNEFEGEQPIFKYYYSTSMSLFNPSICFQVKYVS
jgi:hypothetical protein